MTRKKTKRLTKAILETAKDFYEGGIIDEKMYSKITMRHLNKSHSSKIEPISPKEIREIRAEAHLSQAAFAYYLNLTVGYISQLERGIKKPTGALLTLLNIIRLRGFDIIPH